MGYGVAWLEYKRISFPVWELTRDEQFLYSHKGLLRCQNIVIGTGKLSQPVKVLALPAH